MIKWLNYHHLLYFRVIATEGSIAKASQVLHIGQPALSSQLKQLEESIGHQLFERRNRSLVLTEVGKIALDYADEIFKKGEEFIQVFNNKSFTEKSHFKIGVTDSVPKTLSYKLTEEVQKFSNKTFISLSEGNPQDMINKLRSHEVDLILTNSLVVNTLEGLNIQSVGQSPLSIYGSKKFLSLKDQQVTSIDSLPFILPPTHTKTRHEIEYFFKSKNLHYDLIAEVQDSSLKKLIAENGKALVFLSDVAAEHHVATQKLYKLISVYPLQEEFWLVTSKRTLKNSISEYLQDSFSI